MNAPPPPSSPASSPRTRDTRRRFLIESCDVRGQLCRLDDTWRDALARVDYPAPVRDVLGEAFVAALLLAGTIKFEGRMTLQVRGEGPVHLLVVQVTADGSARGLARWREGEPLGDGGLAALFGENARMIITIEARARAEPHQGIVALEGARLGDALASYFRDSEQLRTELVLAVDGDVAAGLLLQKLPDGERAGDAEEADDGWRRASALAATLSPEELRDRPTEELLHRLFHEERVRVFEREGVRFRCSCSRERTDGMLQGLGRAEVDDIVAERGSVEITCEFCDAEYRYDPIDVEALFLGAIEPDEGVRH